MLEKLSQAIRRKLYIKIEKYHGKKMKENFIYSQYKHWSLLVIKENRSLQYIHKTVQTNISSVGNSKDS